MPGLETQNNQVFIYTKAVNELVLNEVEEVALGSLYQAVSHAMGLGALNAIAAQQQNNVTAQAVTTMGATMLYSFSAALDSAVGEKEIIKSNS